MAFTKFPERDWRKIAPADPLAPPINTSSNPSPFTSPLVNAGVIGGTLAQAKDFINDVVNFLEKCPDEGNWNMIAVNFAASKLDRDSFFMGKPFTSEFKKFNYEFDGYVVHK